MNYFIKLKNLLEEVEEKIIYQNDFPNFSFGNFLAYLSANLTTLLIIVFMVLLAIKLETDSPMLYMHLVNIPMFILLGIMTFYSIFVMPALISNKFYWGIVLIFSYIFNTVIFFILATLKFDYDFKISNLQWFVPVFTAIFIQTIYSLTELMKGISHFVQKVFFAFSNFLFMTAAIYTSVILDYREYRNKGTCILLYTTAYLILIIEKVSILLEGLKNNEIRNDSCEKEKDEIGLLR